jgi:hypothetical protein
MSESIPIIFRLQATVNGETFDMNGEGYGSAADGTCQLHLEADPGFPSGFDPVSCPMICSMPTSLFFARPLVEGADFSAITGQAYQVDPPRRGIVRNRLGEELLNLRVGGRVRLEDHQLISEHTMSGTSHLPQLERNVTPLDDYVMPTGAGQAVGLVRFTLLTRTGEELDGSTVAPLCWDSGRNLEGPLVRHVEDIRVEWDGARRVSSYYRISINTLQAEPHREIPAEFLTWLDDAVPVSGSARR